jgi:hypothetical protein
MDYSNMFRLILSHHQANTRVKHNGMVFIKYNACQARTIYQYKNVKTKLMKCCANIYFNRQCLNRAINLDIVIYDIVVFYD